MGDRGDVGAMKPDRKVYAAALGMEAVLLRPPGEGHTWFDANYRQGTLEWQETAVADLSELLPLL